MQLVYFTSAGTKFSESTFFSSTVLTVMPMFRSMDCSQNLAVSNSALRNSIGVVLGFFLIEVYASGLN